MRSKNIASASAERRVVVNSLEKYMFASSDSTFEKITHSSWKESFESCFGMTNFTLDKSGKENPMNHNHRLVPETVKWIAYKPDSKHEIMYQKKVLQDGRGFISRTDNLDSDEMRKFTDALLTCVPLTSAFKPGGGKSYCPLSKQMQGMRETQCYTYLCGSRMQIFPGVIETIVLSYM